MGNDGGSIPTRRELVKEAAKALTTTQIKEAQNEQQEYAWSTDPLTRKPLARPIVSDSAGKLYNKDSILEFLLPSEDELQKAESGKILDGRVKSLKDVVEVKFEIDTGAESKQGKANGGTGRTEKWICPITNRELGPGAKAVYLVPCGHAFAGSVVKEVAGEICLQCNEPYAENDVIPILPTLPTDIARLSLRMRTLKEKGLTHSLKKASGNKKRKKAAEKEAAIDGAERSEVVRTKASSNNISNSIKNAATASLTAKVLEEQEALNKRRKMDRSLFSNREAQSGKSSDFMTRGFSIPANAKR